MKLREIHQKVLPRLLPLWVAGVVAVLAAGLFTWAAINKQFPETWAAWTDFRFVFGYVLAVTATPFLLSDLGVLLWRVRRTQNAEQIEAWVQSGYDAANDELTHFQPISEAEKKVVTMREYFSTQMTFRWSLFMIMAVAAAIASLVAAVAFLRIGTPLVDFLRPVAMTGCVSILIIVFAGFCGLLNHRLWFIWERLVMAMQVKNPRYVRHSFDEFAEGDTSEGNGEQRESAEDLLRTIPSKPLDDFDPTARVEPHQDGEGSAWGATSSTAPSKNGNGDSHGDWGQVPQQDSQDASWGRKSPEDGGWGQSSGGYNV